MNKDEYQEVKVNMHEELPKRDVCYITMAVLTTPANAPTNRGKNYQRTTTPHNANNAWKCLQRVATPHNAFAYFDTAP
jgi:hypothetical protein